MPDTTRIDITVIGSANVDLILTLPRRPDGGETVLAGGLRTAPGGKGANQAVAAARLADGVRLVGCLGNDAGGELLRGSLADSGVSLEAVRTVDAPTGTAIVMVTPDGENSIVVAPAANSSVDVDLVDATAPLWVGTGGVLVLQLEIPLPTVEYAVRLADSAGTRVVLNAAPAADPGDEVLALADPLVVNRSEALALLRPSQPPGPEFADPELLVTELLRRGPKSVVLTLGADGCAISERGGTPVHLPAYRVTAVDTTGAGDAFIGGLVVELSRGASLAHAAEFASAVSALAVQASGAQTSFPTREAVDHFLAQHRRA